VVVESLLTDAPGADEEIKADSSGSTLVETMLPV
jgi:hypothetical protein